MKIYYVCYANGSKNNEQIISTIFECVCIERNVEGLRGYFSHECFFFFFLGGSNVFTTMKYRYTKCHMGYKYMTYTIYIYGRTKYETKDEQNELKKMLNQQRFTQ